MTAWLALQWEVMRIQFMKMLAYRVVYFTGVFTYAVNIGAYYFLWEAVYRHKSTLGGLDLGQMITYVAVAWISRTFYFNNVDREIADDVRTGKVAVELARPYDYLTYRLSSALGEALFRFGFFTLPGAVFAFLLFPVRLPDSVESLGFFLVSIALSFVINNAINLLTGLTAFFTLNTTGIIRAKHIAIDLLSGLVAPISLFPAVAQQWLRLLPFQSIAYVPTMIYTGALRGEALRDALIQQVFWAVLLMALARALFVYARRRMVVQGG
ncbi:daunorubicin ABC transporter permease [Heliobacterium gestii]|uniref:Daunorubicin ABC transporter permease n=1 Tax=Heliomicrobium gestii TaxID=2699 RepID=A0A845LE61_HELGE|nr:ABC-2 family transporter protein [Heliomicrobium gestii]MBM7866289.1 ABC-2 type transport system permease protein [Heliomicrobium gestii]MZP42919.1 daunorubicin ABC transporter permease [Heliomicrobium gestii]